MIVKLELTQRSDYWSARCTDLPGLHLRASDPEGFRACAPKAIKWLMEHNGNLRGEVVQTGDPAVYVFKPSAASAQGEKE